MINYYLLSSYWAIHKLSMVLPSVALENFTWRKRSKQQLTGARLCNKTPHGSACMQKSRDAALSCLYTLARIWVDKQLQRKREHTLSTWRIKEYIRANQDWTILTDARILYMRTSNFNANIAEHVTFEDVSIPTLRSQLKKFNSAGQSHRW